jgi:hypothetical protein
MDTEKDHEEDKTRGGGAAAGRDPAAVWNGGCTYRQLIRQ